MKEKLKTGKDFIKEYQLTFNEQEEMYYYLLYIRFKKLISPLVSNLLKR